MNRNRSPVGAELKQTVYCKFMRHFDMNTSVM